jgi:DNA-binding transcriptional ArsR family regulator
LAITHENRERLVAMFKALSHPVRFEILQFLLAHPSCITKDVVDALPLSQATVSQHIKILREAGWVASEAKCQATCHWLDNENIAWFKSVVGEIF